MPASQDDIKLLKTMIAAAKNNPVNIGICLGKKPENAVVVMDRKRNPDALGRAAKKEGETTKVATGTVTIEGKKATFTCADKPPSGLAKQLKKFFKSIELPMSFAIIGTDGAEIIESDDDAETESEESSADTGDAGGVADPGADAPAEVDPAQIAWEAAWAAAEPKLTEALRTNIAGADKLRAVRDFMLGKAGEDEFAAAQKSLQTLLGLMNGGAKPVTPTASPTTPESLTEPKPTTALDPKELVEQLKALKPQIAALSGPLAQMLNERYAQAVGLMKPATLEAAAAAIARIASALTRVQAEVVTQTETPAPETRESETSETEAGETETNPPPDPRFAKIGAAKDKLLGQINALGGGDAKDAMMKIIDSISESIEKGEPETALAGMKRIHDGLKLQAEIDRVAPLVAEAASSGKVADVNAMNLLFNMIADVVPAPDHAKALANLARVEAMIKAGADAPSTFEREIPDDVKPFAVSQLNWVNTRTKVRSEIGRLQGAIRTALKEEGGIEDAMKEIDTLLDYVVKLDGRLEDKLNDIVNAADGDSRDKLKREARALLSEYQSELANPFFAEVDSGNGFVDVDVTSSARAALAKISEVLAA